MDFLDNFDDIFLASAPSPSSRAEKNNGGGSPTKDDASKKSNDDGSDSSSSDDSDSSSDDGSVDSIDSGGKDDGGTDSHSKSDSPKKNSGKCFGIDADSGELNETSNVSNIKSFDSSMGDDTDSDDDLDDDALMEFFSSQKSPTGAATKPVEQKQAAHGSSLFDLDDEDLAELEEEEPVGKRAESCSASPLGSSAKEAETKEPTHPADEFDSDDDLFAELNVEEIIKEKAVSRNEAPPYNSSKEKKQQVSDMSAFFDSDDDTPTEMEEEECVGKKSGSSAKTPFRITYNGEKKDCLIDDTLIDTSDDESNATQRSTRSNSKFNTHSTTDKAKGKNDPIYEKENDASSASRNSPVKTNPYKKNKPSPVSLAKDAPMSLSTASTSTVTETLLPDIESGTAPTRSELQRLGIDHAHFKPPKYTPRADPILHRLNESNRPVQRRRKIAVSQIFSRPFSNMFMCKFQEFNHLQSEMCNVIANSDDNVIVSAPTGSGKTALFEMAMCRLFASNLTEHRGGNKIVSNSKKVVYIAPNKALCEERQTDWSKRLMEIDPTIVCTTITGDANTSASSYAEIASAHLILTTPEKWDSITRRWTEYLVLLGSIKLVVLDEVHMIGEPERGACLESVISRMKTIQRAATAKKLTSPEIEFSSFKDTTPEAISSNLRFVAVSATLPNLDQLASFIEAGEAYAFDDSYRPVPLYSYVQACGHIGKNRFLFDKGLNSYVPSILQRFSKGRPSIVFCHSKKETEQLADELTKSYCNPSGNNIITLNTFANQASTSSLQRFIRSGIAYHHAGLDMNDRKVVEEAFMSGSINCLCATSTLAMGVNLPSHLVIVKGTSAYRGASNGHQDIDTGTLLQMIGRAGRPGFDTSGTAVIMTDSASKARFENLSHGLKVVESQLMRECRLTEALNNEIAQGVITTQQEAADWVFGTLLFRRIQAHPLFYGFSGIVSNVCSFVVEKCNDSIEQLHKIKAINVHDDGTFSPAAASLIMSRNFMDLQTMKSITRLPHDSGPRQLLHLLANCARIQSPVRRSEKKHLNEAYKLIKYKLEGPQSKIRIQTPAEKVFVLLQSSIGGYRFEDFALRQEMNVVSDGAVRILTAVEEYSREGSRHGHVLAQSLLLRRSIYHGIWGENDNVLKQIGGVTEDLAAKLKAIGISAFADVMNASSEDISKACNMSLTFGNSLKAAAATVLQCTLKLSSSTKESDGRLNLVVKTERKCDGQLKQSQDNVKYSLLVFTDRAGGLLLSCEDISDESEVKVQCPKKFGRAYVRLISNLVGLDEQVSVDGNDRMEKSAFSLSPKVAKSATKSKRSETSSKPSESNGKRMFDSHRSSVSNVSDLRLHKRGKLESAPKNIECIEIDSDTEQDPSTVIGKKPTRKKPVTPSPHPATKSSRKNDLTPTFGAQNASQENNTVTTGRAQTYSSQKPSTNRPMQNRSKWFRDNRDRKNVQQRAFHSPKENPFRSYTFDPNNIESSIESAAFDSKRPVESSIIPPNFSAHKSKLSTFRTPASKRRNGAASGRISSVGLLKEKAIELQNHHQRTPHLNDSVQRHTMIDAPSRQLNHYDEEIMHGDGIFYNHHRQQSLAPTGYGMQKSFGIPNRPEFAQTFRHDYEPSFMHTQPFTQSFDGPVSSAGRSHGYGMNQSYDTQQPFMRGGVGHHMNMMTDAPSTYGRPTSSAGYSNGSGLQRFSRQSNYGNMNQHQFHQDDHQFQPIMMQEPEVYYQKPSMAMRPTHHQSYGMSQNEHRFGTFDSFNGLDPVDGGDGGQYLEEYIRSDQFEPEEFNGFNAIQTQPRNPYNAIQTQPRNPYSQSKPTSSMPTELPKEIVTVTQQAANHGHAMDDTLLAFNDAFL